MGKKMRVNLKDIDERRENKIDLLRKAATDPLFLADSAEIVSDFENSDKELL